MSTDDPSSVSIQTEASPIPAVPAWFGWVSLSAILQSGFSPRAHLLLPTIGGGPTHLNARSCSRSLPGLTSLHQREHPLFGCVS
jgi:hypothetical protein